MPPVTRFLVHALRLRLPFRSNEGPPLRKLASQRDSPVDREPRLGALVRTANVARLQRHPPAVQPVKGCNAAGNFDIVAFSGSGGATWRSRRSGAVACLLDTTPIRVVMYDLAKR
jgi:hypothetical protein